jgi:putative DNA primase/helicase
MSNMHTPDEQRNNSVTQSRLDLREAGYSPIPVRGKRPLMNGWQTKHEVGRAEIERWEKNFPDQQNTGLLTRTMPTLDVDILDERAATRVQAIAYARFANRGHFLVRVGMPPKRAIPFRTDAPFCKIRIGLYGPNDDREKPAPQALEFLCDGQQVVCHGVHPDTGKPYTWANGHPPNIKWSELPPITEDEARKLVEFAADILCSEHGYTRATESPEVEPKAPEPEHEPDPDDPNRGLNSHALANLDAWVLQLFPSARRSGSGFRVSSASLDRDLQEDISLTPKGIKDFGVHDIGDPNGGRRTPVAVVMEWKPCDQSEAIHWLCERLGIPVDDGPPFSEEAIAIDFANRNADSLRYVARFRRWFVWSGACWREDEKLGVYTIARNVCRETAVKSNKASERKRIASAKTRAAVVSLAGEDPRLAAITDQFDADPWLLCTPDGVVNLRTGVMRAHRPEDYMTKMAAVSPGGDCPKWKKFLKEVTGENEDLEKYLQRVGGYCLTGVTTEQELYFFYGTGRNGKSVFLRTVATILGDYHRTSSIETFTVSQTDRHPTEVAGLRGARLVTATETEDGRRWSEARIKELTGGDKVSARFMHQDFFDFTPQFKLLFCGNHMPALRTVNQAIRRRFRRVPFTVTIAEDKVNTKLADELMEEASGILQWLVDGCLAWQSDGLKPPAAVKEATESYFESQDQFGDWLNECCVVGKTYTQTSGDLFASWKLFCEDRNELPGSKKAFGGKLEDHGFQPFKGALGARFYRGLMLRPPAVPAKKT